MNLNVQKILFEDGVGWQIERSREVKIIKEVDKADIGKFLYPLSFISRNWT